MTCEFSTWGGGQRVHCGQNVRDDCWKKKYLLRTKNFSTLKNQSQTLTKKFTQVAVFLSKNYPKNTISQNFPKISSKFSFDLEKIPN